MPKLLISETVLRLNHKEQPIDIIKSKLQQLVSKTKILDIHRQKQLINLIIYLSAALHTQFSGSKIDQNIFNRSRSEGNITITKEGVRNVLMSIFNDVSNNDVSVILSMCTHKYDKWELPYNNFTTLAKKFFGATSLRPDDRIMKKVELLVKCLVREEYQLDHALLNILITCAEKDLSNMNFNYMCLCNANFRGVNLTYSDMTFTNLTDADLTNADLRNTIINHTNLLRAKLDNAIVDLNEILKAVNLSKEQLMQISKYYMVPWGPLRFWHKLENNSVINTIQSSAINKFGVISPTNFSDNTNVIVIVDKIVNNSIHCSAYEAGSLISAIHYAYSNNMIHPLKISGNIQQITYLNLRHVKSRQTVSNCVNHTDVRFIEMLEKSEGMSMNRTY